MIEQINQLISQGSSEAEKIIETINSDGLEADTVAVLNSILDAVKSYDFNYAQSLLKKLDTW